MNFVYFAVIIGCVFVGHGEGKTCYEVTCFSKNCLEEVINSGTAGYCTMDESYGCEVSKMSTNATVIEIATCSVSSCKRVYNAPALDNICCNENNCNTGNITSGPAPSSNTCYEVTCFSKNCLEEVINSGTAGYCTMDESYGCEVTKISNDVTDMEIATCSTSSCKRVYNAPALEIMCCNENICNTGNMTSGPAPSSNTCYEVTCFSKNCLEEVINSGTAGYCTMDESYGCEVTKISNDVTDMEIATCSTSSCKRVYNAPALEIMCCNENICNTGNMTSGPAPSSNTCYEVTCFSKNCLEEVINSGTAGYCTMDESYGCEVTKISNDVTDMEIATCSTSSCKPAHSAPALDIMCCNENICNTGNMTSGPVPASGLCHSYICSNGDDCLKNGIKDGYSRTCPMDPKYGCYALKATTASSGSVLAGCSDSRCLPAKISYGSDTSESICCSSNLCNDDETNTGGKIRTSHLAPMTFIIAGLLIMMNVY